MCWFDPQYCKKERVWKGREKKKKEIEGKIRKERERRERRKERERREEKEKRINEKKQLVHPFDPTLPWVSYITSSREVRDSGRRESE
jgi:hypothetical protein